MNQDIILEIQDVKKHFYVGRNKTVKAVDGVSLKIKKGETLGLVGESGCGKSTLGRTIIKIYEPTGGKIFFEGEDISGPGKYGNRRLVNKMQMIFQDPFASLNPRMTVGDIIAEGWDIQRRYKGMKRKERIVGFLELVGLNEEHANRFPHEFSGGQRQRIGIARALTMEPSFIICDEPISALDVSIQAQVVNLLMDLQKKMELTYMFISHDLSMVRHISDNIAVMYLGSIMEYAGNIEIYSNPLHPYTKALFSAIPIPNPKIERERQRIMLEGDVPSPITTSTGCKFSSRCFLAKEICKLESPKLTECQPGHYVACHFVG
jgi:oligopeptide transport system ATP-binding protein